MEIMTDVQVHKLANELYSRVIINTRRNIRILAGSVVDYEKYESVILRQNQKNPCYLWFTLMDNQSIVVLLTLTNDDVFDLSKVYYFRNRNDQLFHPGLSFGTLLSGRIAKQKDNTRSAFLVEDLLIYKSTNNAIWTWAETLSRLLQLFSTELNDPSSWPVPIFISHVLNTQSDFTKYPAVEYCFRSLHTNAPDIITAVIPKMNMDLFGCTLVNLLIKYQENTDDSFILDAYASFPDGPFKRLCCGAVVDDSGVVLDTFKMYQLNEGLFDCSYCALRCVWVPMNYLPPKKGSSNQPIEYLKLCM